MENKERLKGPFLDVYNRRAKKRAVKLRGGNQSNKSRKIFTAEG